MNTQYIKKMAIAKQLGEMLEHSCKYSPTTPAQHGFIEPDTNALAIFQTKVSWLAYRHFHDLLTRNDVMEVHKYCYNIGYSVGHILSQGRTGTWGVRLAQLENIMAILEIEDFDIAGYGNYVTVLDKYNAEIKSIQIESNWIWMNVEFENEYGHTENFPISYDWKELRKISL